MRRQGRPGPGKYHPEVERLRIELGAEALVVFVVGGSRGHGMEAQVVAGPHRASNTGKLGMVLIQVGHEFLEEARVAGWAPEGERQ